MRDHSDSPASRTPSHTYEIVLAAIALLCSFLQREPNCSGSDRISSLVQLALKSEIRLDSDQRGMLIDAALKEDPNHEEAHWARGDVRVRGQWLSLEDAAAAAASRSNLLKYQERRRSADDTVRGQARLAEYCHQSHLPAQERAHWAAVIALDPDHQEAHRRLGQINVNGAWMDRRQVDKQKKTELATVAFLEKHSKRLTALSIALQDESMTPTAVIRELRQFRNPLVIPGLEFLFSRSGEAGGLCTVETVDSLTAPEASLSLAKHALDFTDESVRVRATRFLKRRDELSYVPDLLGALQTRVAKEDGFAINHHNQIIWRQRLFFETQDTKQIMTFNRVFQVTPRVAAQSIFNPEVAERLRLESDIELDAFNDAIEQKNERVMQLLASTTADKSEQHASTRKTPEDWWNWWNDRIESYPSDAKAVVARYETSYKMVIPPGSRHECLAAGTPIWTETGSVAVDQVKVGDLVLSQNQRTGELTFASVLTTTTRPPERLLCLKINDEIVRATGGHPFWVSGKGWTKARSLKPGMGLHTARGVAIVNSIEEEQQPTETFNLIVDDCHSYFVGTTLVLSHDNSTCEPVANRVPGLREDGDLVSRNEK
ncbi:polymorphic toxin-type HINT domain-containing protein [Schlesneria paludicola]|uniref:polymorphic toxin-type HINT domain-containing protein n=1 Tax=Schlesneria paludicola TaxID=360056 RepID=UPI00029AFE97|nr:polymorphic toxin-type HINT domain-containing protein [Schlesneria paludicola]